MSRVVFTDAALDDLRRAGPGLAPRVLDDVLLLEREPGTGVALVADDTGYRVLATAGGTRRIVHQVSGDVVTVCAVALRGVRTDGEVYAETLERMQGADPPEVVALARLIRRLGRLTGVVPVPRRRMREPVPDWLAERLVGTAGRERLAVAAMDAATAFEAWNRFLSEPA